MTLIKSISGIRGTIGGKPGAGLSPLDIVKFTASFATILKQQSPDKNSVVVGRDARVSGQMVSQLVISTLAAMGLNVVDIGLAATPTVEMAVTDLNAGGGVIVTASHNPWQWNALKLLDEKGEFISGETGEQLLAIADAEDFTFAEADKLGQISYDDTQLRKHIEKILNLPYVNSFAIKMAKFRVAVDAVNSVGGIAVPLLLKSLGVEMIDELHCEPTGKFAHNPEPLPEHLSEISKLVEKNKAHVGFVVDPDVDRLAIICEDGGFFGEEYTLVAVADYVLSIRKGNTVSNLSSTQALRDITEKAGCKYFSSAVGEVNVVARMKEVDAIIGGEGNGGVILPELHYGRDALVGIAIFLSMLAESGKRCTALRNTFPDYFVSKNKIQLSDDMDVDKILAAVAEKYKNHPLNTIDGVKIEFDKEWVHLRRSNTEAIIRIYSESDSMVKAEVLAGKLLNDIKDILRSG
ncbi:MAG: phosphoglucosamine mutase [Lentimicrobium sp.]|jgi:phosphomannomutase|nr:phosphoglucosamine mutase [Lentimicrobium sp.]MDD2528611.1 phosphoglucosamine mutase [Lentimicrobiaceae bacterium]MDD4598318.1 phosphoglucosamine mutase [Lentimicrobiaceae bacterium]MDY0027128.1 phosphoglucosamine mutase [Lentimicrobium sp.]HAH58421.1 phosphoglucosamine mutase [Bacteroidales bacterium]